MIGEGGGSGGRREREGREERVVGEEGGERGTESGIVETEREGGFCYTVPSGTDNY